VTAGAAARVSPWAEIERRHAMAWSRWLTAERLLGPPPRPRGLIVGEAPGPNTDARFPLFPHPSNSAGARLLKYSGVEPTTWLGKLVRVNLCDGAWSARRAAAGRARVLAYLLDDANFYDGEPLRVLLLGARVARTWSCYGSFGYVEEHLYQGGGVNDRVIRMAWIPHPSGRCRLYNDRRNQLRARRAVLWALGERSAP